MDVRVASVTLTFAEAMPTAWGTLKAREEAGIEAEVLEQVGAEKVEAAKAALAALLAVVGLDERVRSRSVPLPDQ